MRLNPINKKGQEEMAGFILIIIMFIVMGMAFLFLAKPKLETKKDLQAGNLLNSMLESTERGKTVGENIEFCVSNNIQNQECRDTFDGVSSRLNAALFSSGLVLNRTLLGYVFNATSGMTSRLISNGTLMGNSLTVISPKGKAEITLKLYYP